jgi:hypothetical protein
VAQSRCTTGASKRPLRRFLLDEGHGHGPFNLSLHSASPSCPIEYRYYFPLLNTLPVALFAERLDLDNSYRRLFHCPGPVSLPRCRRGPNGRRTSSSSDRKLPR